MNKITEKTRPNVFRTDTSSVMSVAFSPDGKWLATGSWDHTVVLWDASTGQKLRTLQGHTGSVASVAFSPNATCLVTRSQDGSTGLWDAQTGEELAPADFARRRPGLARRHQRRPL